MRTILEIWQSIVGEAPDYFTIGQSNSVQWHYGELLEYAFVCIVTVFIVALIFKLLFTVISLAFGGGRK